MTTLVKSKLDRLLLGLLTILILVSTASAQRGLGRRGARSAEELAANRPATPGELQRVIAAAAPGAEQLPAEQYKAMRMERATTQPSHVYRTHTGLLVRMPNGDWSFARASDEDPKLLIAWMPASADELIQRVRYNPLPPAPEGFKIDTFAELPHAITRLAHDMTGRFIFALGREGDLWGIEIQSRKAELVRPHVVDPGTGETGALGLAIDRSNRVYFLENIKDESTNPFQNRITIHRSTGPATDERLTFEPWLKASYPWGVGGYNHGTCHMAFGPDGMLYVGSGSRTDADEPGQDPNLSAEGEVELTSCIWRIDPAADDPKIEIFADGLRNPFGFIWDAAGRMVATESGPNAMPPEEVNIVEKGKHYGFPYRFSNWDINPYHHVKDAPPGLTFVDPIECIGPDGTGPQKRKMSTLEPHTSPVGIALLGPDFGEWNGQYLIARFGSLVPYGPRVRGDVVRMELIKGDDGVERAEVHQFMANLARPIDVHVFGGKIYIVEFSRTADEEDWPRAGMSGRILELSRVK